MRKFSLMKSNALVFFIAGMLAAAPALAEKPSWAGGEKGDRGKHNDRHDKHSKQDHDSYDRDERGDGRHQHFGEQQRVVVREYYVEQYRKGRCPPGLAKKRNGCMPPGHAKKWKIGRPLPREVIYYDLPPAVVMQIGPPPSGHRYVRVASDILLIAIGTGMIVDAIEDLSR
ncbi:hypothetical protein GALLN_00448 [Gallionellaceae bacterium]|nr:hypothetical protein GALLN_00448 [Gallionellaceae bacterium]